MGSAQDLAAIVANQLQRDVAEYIDQDEVRGDFCGRMRKAVPEQCDIEFGLGQYWPSNPSNMLSIVMVNNTPPMTNGCGTGSFLEIGAAAILDLINFQGFSGDVNAPYSGTSFLNACNSHDRCYSGGASQLACDNQFQSDLYASCGNNNDCLFFADVYTGAVRAEGTEAYENAQGQNECRDFAEDYENSSCNTATSSGTGF